MSTLICPAHVATSLAVPVLFAADALRLDDLILAYRHFKCISTP